MAINAKKVQRETNGSSQEHKGFINNKILRARERLVKFTEFFVVAVKEMSVTFGLVYKKYYLYDSSAGFEDPILGDERNNQKISCPICSREFSNNDAVVRCPDKSCGEIYHYLCWQFSHGCVRPGCLSNLENPRNLILH